MSVTDAVPDTTTTDERLPAAAAGGADTTDDRRTADGDRRVGEGFALLLPFARDGWYGFALAGLMAFGSTVAMLGVFYVVYRAVLIAVGVDAADSADLYRLAAIALVLVIVDHILQAGALYTSHRFAFATLARLRLRIGERLGRVPLGFLTRRRSGEIQRTLADDVERLELFLAHALPDTVAAVSVLSITTVWIFLVDWRLGLATVLTVLIAFPIMARGMAHGSAKMGGHAEAMARMNGSVVEFIRGMPVIRVFNRTGADFDETSRSVEAAAQFQSQWAREILPSFSLFFVLVSTNVLGIVPVGILLWRNGSIDTRTLLFFFVFGLGYSAPILKLMEFFTSVSHLTFGANAILVLSEAEVLPEAEKRVDLVSPVLAVEDVGFSHIGPDGGSRRVLDGVSFVAEPGTVTALVGPSGSGKTTLAKLLCRFWDPADGTIRIDGHDLQ
ncbi:MAG: ABC transporter ATP-binding protein, partial [Actinomycetota bacterium]